MRTATPRKVLILGGYGFIGRHAARALRAAGHEVTLGSRRPPKSAPPGLEGLSGRSLRLEQRQSLADWREALAGFEAVLNCVGILRQRGAETYDRVHHRAPAALAEACRERGLRFIHVSALGLDGPVRSRFLTSKREGERAIRAVGGDWIIVRPSLLDAEDAGFGARWMRRVAHWPFHPLPADARGRIDALRVEDLALALTRLVDLPLAADAPAGQREFELGGDHPRPLADYLADLRAQGHPHPARVLALPAWLARAGSHVCDLLHFSPYSYGHWELLRRDNRPQPNRLPELLGRAPMSVGLARESPAPDRHGLAHPA